MGDLGSFMCTLGNETNTVRCNGTLYKEVETLHPGTREFDLSVGICVLLIVCAGIFSGLTLGMLSLDSTHLQVLIEGGKPHEQKYAKKIKPLVKRHHLLLVTLLLANAGVNETLPLFLDKLVPEYVAIIISVTAVLLFGEVIPQALCSKYGLAIGAFFSPFVWFCVVITFPLSYPLSKLLDVLLGTCSKRMQQAQEQGSCKGENNCMKAIQNLHTWLVSRSYELLTKI
eukprot:m.29619 g.29619  ORF g.29619 m.29619 type:complete len:228 (-) comp9188_c0_seq2:1158-1841(-)